MGDSLAKQVARLPLEEQERWLDGVEIELRLELAKNPWWFIGRPEQLLPEGEWFIWLLMTGRRFGKTRAAAENLVLLVLEYPVSSGGAPTEWAIIGETFSDCRKIMVEGPSGLLGVFRRRGMVENVDFVYNRSQWEITLTSGQKIHMMGADDADVGRGFGLEGLWGDEIAKWPYAARTWTEGLMPTLSDSSHPRAIITTTPRPGHELIKQWLRRTNGSVVITRGSIDDNKDNLSPELLAEMHDLYDDTRIGKQELGGEFLEDVPGALWSIDDIRLGALGDSKRIVIAVDPAVTNTAESDETGIIVCAKASDNRLLVLGDHSCRDSVLGWAQRVNACFEQYKADLVVYEANQGGDAIAEVLRSVNPYLPLKPIHAKIGKRLRAEPVAALYQQGKVFHVEHFDKLENQMLTWEADDPKSPDRLDALVHCLTELADIGAGSRFLQELAQVCESCGQPNVKGASVCFSCHKAFDG
jgi:phage terminase large subunit-like protein